MRIFILFGLLSNLTSCQKDGQSSQTPEESAVPEETAETAEETKNIATVVYEAVFLDSEEIAALFEEVRGPAPYEKFSADSHVTITFFPEQDARELYGKEVTVKITGYKAGDVTSDEGDTVQAEGFRVELVSDDPEVQA